MWYILGGENSEKINIHDLSVFFLAIFGLGLGEEEVKANNPISNWIGGAGG